MTAFPPPPWEEPTLWGRYRRVVATLAGGVLLVVGLTALGVPTWVANPGARAIGAMFGYVGNGAYTFRQPEGAHRLGRGSLARFVLLWLVLTAASTAALALIDGLGGLGWAWGLKPVVDLGLAAVAFVASRLWVYR